MDTNKTGGAAFPIIQNKMTDTGFIYTVSDADGMTLLDYFAAKFAAAEIANIDAGNGIPTNEVRTNEVAKLSYKMAAAMIEERKKYI